MEVKTSTPAQTKTIAKKIAASLKPGDLITLVGPLGAGKTIFIQGLAQGLGIKKRILSPSFVFMRSYQITKNRRPLIFYHLDLYRAKSRADYEFLGLEELFAGDAIIAIEWAEKIASFLPKNRINVKFSVINEKIRKITINGNR